MLHAGSCTRLAAVNSWRAATSKCGGGGGGDLLQGSHEKVYLLEGVEHMRCHPQPTEPVPVLGGHQHAPLPERHLNRVASARLLFERVTPPKLSQSAEESSFIIALDDKVHGWVAGVSMLQLEWLRHPSAMSRTAISFGFATVTPTMCDPPPSAPATGTPNAPASVKPAAVTPARRRSASSASRCWTYTDTN